MDDSRKHLAQEREEIARRIANFRATQERFEREREDFLQQPGSASARISRHPSDRDGPRFVKDLNRPAVGKNGPFYKNSPAS